MNEQKPSNNATTVKWHQVPGDTVFSTEVAKHKYFGDVGYLYKEGHKRWIGIYICENGDEMESTFDASIFAKKWIRMHLHREITEGREV